MIGHLGPRASALLDGQLPLEEEERAWAHLDHCASCHAEVQRQGWVKTRLAGLSLGAEPDAGGLTTALLAAGPPPTGEQLLRMSVGAAPVARRSRPRPALAVLGTGAAGAVALGVLTVVAPPADAPVRQTPAVRPLDAVRTPATAVPVRLGRQR